MKVLELTLEAMKVVRGLEIDRDRLPMWVVTDHPKDHPNHFVARLHYSLPKPEATALCLVTKSLDGLRDYFSAAGLVRFDRHPDDDPVIVETWMV